MSPLPCSSSHPEVHGMFDPATWTVTYVVHNGPGSDCAVIDSVLDYDPKSGRTRHASADKVVEYVHAHDLKVQWIPETQAHADHLSAAPYLRTQLGGKIGIGGLVLVAGAATSTIGRWGYARP
ncbi:glyoxylase-like metal-dependent hydrolase (beta-lactamase superfamily II) [Ottowia thiooxydans]|uniref:Glyoxylase-like metal-dependent hydrolase (Beta-lactamase superfamily II) n=1 Tax=Ottowia thiooxydans TaxID=219182 RepID=A0ABV2Q688_9BURK